MKNISTGSPEELAVRDLYRQLLEAWNRRSAASMAALFAPDGSVVGFDGSQMNGQAEIETALGQVFADHQTAAYVWSIREVRFLAASVALLRAAAGLVPPGKDDVNPAVNALQSLVAVRQGEKWQIALFQNTPAQFHGRPDLSENLTEELRQALRAGR